MNKEDHELYLLTEVEWWLYFNTADSGVDFTTEITEEDIRDMRDVIICYHGDVFGVHTIVEVRDLEKMAEKHNVEVPHCIVGG